MGVSNVAWIRDHQHRAVLELSLDGHSAHILSEQKLELIRRGIVRGVDFLASEWRAEIDRRFIHGELEPGLAESDLAGCTNDPGVFALYQEMCSAIRDGTWQPGPRSPVAA